MKSETLPPCDKPCDCCGRVHRCLKLVWGGYWLGKSCAVQVDFYRSQFGADVNQTYWRGYEKKHAQVAKMLGA